MKIKISIYVLFVLLSLGLVGCSWDKSDEDKKECESSTGTSCTLENVLQTGDKEMSDKEISENGSENSGELKKEIEEENKEIEKEVDIMIEEYKSTTGAKQDALTEDDIEFAEKVIDKVVESAKK